MMPVVDLNADADTQLPALVVNVSDVALLIDDIIPRVTLLLINRFPGARLVNPVPTPVMEAELPLNATELAAMASRAFRLMAVPLAILTIVPRYTLLALNKRSPVENSLVKFVPAPVTFAMVVL